MDALLFTHEHADHTAGLDDIRPFFFRQGNIHIYGHERVINNLTQRFGYIFTNENKYPGAPSVDTHFIHKNQSFLLKGKEITPIEVWHGNWQVFGFRMGNFAYLTDVKTIEEDQLEKLQNLDVLVLNTLREKPHQTHIYVPEALAFMEVLKPKRCYFTHISHSMGFHEEAQAKLPPNVFLAYDTLTLEI
jgi:phosphoribosyl 1,2-cyclic phosphate phosphodiesterase